MAILRWTLAGALIAVTACFPLAALTALVFRFPIPFAGYRRGWEAAAEAPAAMHFYALTIGSVPGGGYALLAVLGALAGYAGARIVPATSWRASSVRVLVPVAAALTVVIALAVWDLVFGPW